MIHERAFWRLLACVVRDAHLALGNRARGKVQHNRPAIGVGSWDAHGERIGDKARFSRAVRGHPVLTDGIGEVNGDQALGDRLLRPVTHAPQMMRIAQTHHTDASVFCTLNGNIHRLMRDALTNATLGIENHQTAGIGNDLHLLIEHQFARSNRLHITRHHAHAVRIVTAEIRQHEMVSGEPRLRFRRTRSEKSVGHPAVENVGVDCAISHVTKFMFLVRDLASFIHESGLSQLFRVDREQPLQRLICLLGVIKTGHHFVVHAL